MTVQELYELCKTLKSQGYGDLQVILSSDAEGNAFRPLANDYSTGEYKKNGDFMDGVLKKVNAVCLWPV